MRLTTAALSILGLLTLVLGWGKQPSREQAHAIADSRTMRVSAVKEVRTAEVLVSGRFACTLVDGRGQVDSICSEGRRVTAIPGVESGNNSGFTPREQGVEWVWYREPNWPLEVRWRDNDIQLGELGVLRWRNGAQFANWSIRADGHGTGKLRRVLITPDSLREGGVRLEYLGRSRVTQDRTRLPKGARSVR